MISLSGFQSFSDEIDIPFGRPPGNGHNPHVQTLDDEAARPKIVTDGQ